MEQAQKRDTQAVLRRSTRTRANPAHLNVYDISLPPSLKHSIALNANSIRYPISDFLSSAQISDSHYAFTAAITPCVEPKRLINKLEKWMNGRKQCNLRYKLWRELTLGHWLIYQMASIVYAVNGSIKSSTRQMVQLNVMKHAWLLRDICRKKESTIFIPFHQLPNSQL